MSITMKFFLLAILGFIVLNSILTVIFGTFSWLVDRYGWIAWTGIIILLAIIGIIFYINFGDLISTILIKIQ